MRSAIGQTEARSIVNEQLRTFLGMLGDATSHVGAEYFRLPVHGSPAKYRERLYCYELYHQLRCALGEFPFNLGGEIDKGGHPHFVDGPFPRSKPDLLVHVPGSMNRNLAIVEVKRATVRREAIRGDLLKLRWYCDHAAYSGGVFLVYGEVRNPDMLAQKIREAADKTSTDLTRITCLHHRQVGERAQRIL